MATTDFGFKTVDEQEKAKRVRGVFDSVAAKYDVMNDLMSMGLHRAWKAYTVMVANLQLGDKVLTSCPSCMSGLNRFQDDLQNGLLEAEYIVVEMAKKLLGENWMAEYVQVANAGGIERVLV